MGSSRRDKVDEFVIEEQWRWPSGVIVKVSELSREIPINISNKKDSVVWCSRNGRRKLFQTRLVWQDIRIVRPRVEWCNLVWFSNSIPKHAFILWLAVR